MGKTKKKKKDFQKVKLKVGRKLPQGQNVTNTSFKTRSIQIVQQLKGATQEPSTRRKQNIGDLLSRCLHHSISVRRDAVSGLIELLTSNPHMKTSHLSLVLGKTTQLLTDRDPAVRQAVLRLYKEILPSVSTNQIEPFFPVLSARLCSAMTHIFEDIQEDSLKIFDLLLKIYPVLVTSNSSQILQNFIEQISRPNTGRKSEESDKLGHSLAVKPNSRISSQKWQSDILSRLHNMLMAISASMDTQSTHSEKKNIHWHLDSVLHCQPFPTYFKNAWNHHGFRASVDFKEREEVCLEKFVKMLVPLLLQCWVESHSKQSARNSQDNLVLPAAMSVMSRVLGVIQMLWECLDLQDKADASSTAWLKMNYLKDFCQHFMHHFPYAVHDRPVKYKKVKKDLLVIPVESVNLAVCDIMTYFLDRGSIKTDLEWMSDVMKYVMFCLQQRKLSADQVKTIIKILNKLIKHCPNTENLRLLLEKAVLHFSKCHPLSAEKRLYLTFFGQLVLNDDFRFISRYEDILSKFLESLPELLPLFIRDNQQTASLLVAVIRQALSQDCSAFLKRIGKTIPSIIDPECWVNTGCPEDLQKSVLEILYWLPEIDTSVFHSLTRVCHHSGVATTVCRYLLDIVHHRFVKMMQSNSNPAVETVSYVSFLYTVLRGESADDLNNKSLEDITGKSSQFHIQWTGDKQALQKHSAVVKIACSLLSQLPGASQLLSVMDPFWARILVPCSSVSLKTVIAVLTCWNMYFSREETLANRWGSVISSLCFSLAYNIVLKESIGSDDVMHTDISSLLWMLCHQCLVSSCRALSAFLQQILTAVEESQCEETTSVLVKVVVQVLQQGPIQQAARDSSCVTHIENIYHRVQSTYGGLEEKQRLNDLSYLMSLLQSAPASSPRRLSVDISFSTPSFLR